MEPILLIDRLKELFPKEGRALFAVSGGIDSMCMATAAIHAGLKFAVAHCNFHLRGDESDADENLVRMWCDNAGVECFVASFDTSRFAASSGISIEMAARQLRYGWFAKLCSEQRFDAVAVAHNANDNAETLLLNLVRGTGIKGLCGMRERSSMLADGLPLDVVRPLLSFSRAQIADFAGKYSVPFREDRSNADVSFKRNRVRHEVLPSLEAMNPSILRTLSEDMLRFRMVSDISDDYFEDFLRECNLSLTSFPIRLSLSRLFSKRHWKYLLYRFLSCFEISGSDIESAAGILESGTVGASGKRFIGKDFLVMFTSSELVISRSISAWEPVTVDGTGTLLCGNTSVEVSEIEARTIDSSSGDVFLDADRICFPLELRQWREGDWMCPLGMGGKRRKLSDIFVSLKIPVPAKKEVILLAIPGSDGRIGAIVGHGKIDESLKVTDATRRIIRLKTGTV